MLATRKLVLPMDVLQFFCTAGPTIFTATSMLLLCLHRRGTGRSFHICAAMARRAFFPVKRFGMASKQRDSRHPMLRIVILGGGFAGEEAARYLDRTVAKRS